MKAGAIFLAAASLLAAPAIAQPRSGDDQVAARRALRTFAACLLADHGRVANDVLLQPLGSEPQQQVIDRRVAGVNDCMGANAPQIRFNALTLAGALAEAGLQARFDYAELGRVAALDADRVALLNLEPRTGYEDLGLCVARRAPEAVWAWAVSEPGSDAEMAARRTVIPQVGPCVNQGEPLKADYVGLRAILSAGLYRAMRLTRP